MESFPETLEGASLRRIPYRQALERQRELVAARLAGEIPDLVWYLEHGPVVSWKPGRGEAHLRVAAERLGELGVALEPTDRGGDVTYHGPGQLVAYPIVDLGHSPDRGECGCATDLHAYLRALEEALVAALSVWGIEGFRIAGRTGVWTRAPGGAAKIAAIGVRARRWVTSHGFALNISCDLGPFRDLIVPCGISDAGVTSMEEVLGGRPPRMDIVVPVVHDRLETVLNRRLSMTCDGFEWTRGPASPPLSRSRDPRARPATEPGASSRSDHDGRS